MSSHAIVPIVILFSSACTGKIEPITISNTNIAFQIVFMVFPLQRFL
jgi:hypothetical protein